MRASEWASEQTPERGGVCERRNQCRASNWMSGASEQVNGPVLYVDFLVIVIVIAHCQFSSNQFWTYQGCGSESGSGSGIWKFIGSGRGSSGGRKNLVEAEAEAFKEFAVFWKWKPCSDLSISFIDHLSRIQIFLSFSLSLSIMEPARCDA